MTDVHSLIPENAVRVRSYLIWQNKGCPEGCALDHWLQAESELEAELRAGLRPHRPLAYVSPRPMISCRPRKSVSAKLKRESPCVPSSAARR